MNIAKMSDAGAVTTVNEICDGIKNFVKDNPEAAKELLVQMHDGVLEPLNDDDFFGTEGWEHAFGLD